MPKRNQKSDHTDKTIFSIGRFIAFLLRAANLRIAIICVLYIASVKVHAQILDSSFGTGGFVTLGLQVNHLNASNVLELPDGSYALTGWITQTDGPQGVAFCKLLETGVLDSTVGVSQVSVGTSSSGNRACLDAGGNIIISGWTRNAVAGGFLGQRSLLVCLNNRGNLVQSFGSGGVLEFPNSSDTKIINTTLSCCSVDSNSIYAWGTSTDYSQSDTTPQQAMVRATAGGNIDHDFGNNGSQNIGRGVTTGAKSIGNQEFVSVSHGLSSGFIVSKVSFDGRPVVSFGTNGTTTITVPPNVISANIIQDHAGRYVAVGSGRDSSGPVSMALARLMPNGAPDATFSGDGSSVHGFPGSCRAGAVTEASDGALYVGGVVNGKLAVLCINEQGEKDVSFGDNGLLMTNIDATECVSICIDHKGRIVTGSLKIEAGYIATIITRILPKFRPVVFIPGIAGSILIGGDETGKHGNGEYLWPSLDALDIRSLNLRTGSPDVQAVGVLQSYDPGYTGLFEETFYGPFMDFMRTPANGHMLFDLDEYPSRMTTGFQSATSPPIGHPPGLPFPKPTLFPFPYDWRKSNPTHTATLSQYIDNISQLHGGAKVNVVAHSMGGLLLRRYILEYGSAKIDKVVTVGTPFWGAPVAIYRMLKGDLYDIALVDVWNNDAVKESLMTFPAFHELLPSRFYLQNAGRPVFSESGWDFDNDRVSTEDYSTGAYLSMIDAQASPDTPSINNFSFHNYLGGRQDDWRTDDGLIKYLHVYGDRPNNTTIGVTVETVYNRGSVNRGGLAYPKFREIKGSGDKVVPTLSSHRLGSYTAPGALYQAITATEDGSEHSGMMKNIQVWNTIVDFFDDGQLTPSSTPLAAGQRGLSALGRRMISVRGASYVRVSDALGNTNTKLNDSVAKRVPGVEIRYGGSQPWVDIDCAANQTLFIESDAPILDMEIVVTDSDSSGVVTVVTRYRYQPNTSVWRLGVASAQEPDLKVDHNNNGSYESDEHVAPTHTASGGSVDTTAPTVSVNFSVADGKVTMTLSGLDGTQPTPTVFYALDGGLMQTYIGPLVFPPTETRLLKVLAEDAMGNVSGLIESAINPAPSISSQTSGIISVQWPISEAYVLEESIDLLNWNPSSLQISKTGIIERVSVPIGGSLKRFFRLRAQTITK